MQTQVSKLQESTPVKLTTHVVEAIEGRFRSMPTIQLCLAWWLYNSGHISRRQLRVSMALHEMHERRRYTKTGGGGGKRRPSYSVEEVAALVGGRGSETAIKELKSDIRSLAKIGLAIMSEHRLEFASSPEAINVEDLDSFWEFWDQIPNRKRSVPVPRRTLRALAAGFSKAVTGTIIALIIRSVHWHKREGEFRVDGRTKGSWLSKVFGLSRRAVTDARATLIELGWLEPQDTPQVLLNRFGNHDRINVACFGNRKEKITQSEQGNSASPESEKEGENASPYINSLPSSLKKSQNNRSSGRVTAPDPKLVFHSNEIGRRGLAAKKTNLVPKPNLRDIRVEHLRDNDALLKLYDQAVAERLIERSDRGRIDFVAFAERARSRGRNPGSLFVWLVKNRKFEFITQADEDAAARRVKQHLFPDQPRTAIDDETQPQPAKIPEDHVVRTCLQLGRKFKTRPFTIAQKSKGWTRDKWDKALEDFELRFGPVHQ